jgi:bifunctional non-homologous end joining protein LigD
MAASSHVIEKVRIGRRELELVDLRKRLFPSGFTKAEVIAYYTKIAPLMLPHLRGRGVTIKRYPRGTVERVFFEKQCPPFHPPWVRTRAVPRQLREGDIDYCLIDDIASLVWVINLDAIELHVPLAHSDDWNRPREMVFDLDPGQPATRVDCCRLGVRFRDMLGRIGLQSFAKTSGGKGLHVYVPLNTPGVTFDQTKQFAHAAARIFEKQEPAHVVSVMTRSLRRGKVFVDWSQNDRTKTTVCAYSLRAKGKPTVSTPLTWKEVEAAAKSGDASSLVFEAKDVLARVTRSRRDLFAPVLTLKQRLPA